jgi:hypothetical protein
MEITHQYVKDEVIFDLLNFLNQFMDSNKYEETWYSILEYGDETYLSSLFDKDQKVCFGMDHDYLNFMVLDNNKLLLISCLPDEYRTYFGYKLNANADNFEVEVKEDNNGIKTIIITDGTNREFLYENVAYLSNNLPVGKNKLVDLVRPISFEQLLERGNETEVKKGVK